MIELNALVFWMTVGFTLQAVICGLILAGHYVQEGTTWGWITVGLPLDPTHDYDPDEV